jgi:predicted signal transduction protein with EAL and GGDEF domain
VEKVAADDGSGAIVEAVVSLARALALRTVAEGIETSQQLRRVRATGVELGQGYLFGRPQPADTFGDLPVRMVVPKKRQGALPAAPAGVDPSPDPRAASGDVQIDA